MSPGPRNPEHQHEIVPNTLLALVPDRKQLEHARLQRVAARRRACSTTKRPRFDCKHDNTLASNMSYEAQDENFLPRKRFATEPTQRYVPVTPNDRFWSGAIKVCTSHTKLTSTGNL